MPATILNEEDLILLRSPAVVGERANGTAFVQHVALLLPEDENGIRLSHKGDPPTVIHVRGGFARNRDIKPYVVAWIEKLDGQDANDASAKIRTVVSQIETRLQFEPISWRAHPPYSQQCVTVHRDGVTRREIHWHFSCAGFVYWCFKEALGIELVVDTTQLPEVRLTELRDYYELPDDPSELTGFGLNGPGPWRLLLPGYIIHALDKSSSPHKPADFAEAYFPIRAN